LCDFVLDTSVKARQGGHECPSVRTFHFSYLYINFGRIWKGPKRKNYQTNFISVPVGYRCQGVLFGYLTMLTVSRLFNMG
jgi:hypothetical protein